MATIVLRGVKGSPLTNNEVDSNFSNLNIEVGQKQDTLVSGTNIKTIGGQSVLGSGNIEVGGVTSVAMAVPTGLSVSGSPITGSGTFTVSYASGYAIPTTAKQTQWDTAYGWGNHATAGYQANLVSGSNIKTLNGNSLLGSGNITISGGATIQNETASSLNFYPGMAGAATGNWTTAYVTSNKFYFVPNTGTLHCTEFQSLSDARQKDNVETIIDALGVINKLRGVNFNWKENGKASSGVIAQEVEEVLPFLVDTNEEGVKSVNYDAIIGYLIEAVKTLTKDN